MQDRIDNIKATVTAAVWGTSPSALPPVQREAVKAVQILHMVLRELSRGTLTLRAASLVFSTLLSLVPLLAVSFSLLKAFGVVHTRIEEVLSGFLDPLGERGVEISDRIVGFVDQVDVGVLGGVGLLILLFTVISVIQKVESSLNATWRVRRSRNFVQRFSGYLSVLLVGPVVMVTALGVIGTLTSTPLVQSIASVEPFGTLLALVTKLIPYLLMIAVFSFVYMLMPNTRVRFVSALAGGVVAGVLWATAGWAFAAFVVNSPSSNYAAIYSSFAIVFFFILWMYVAWLILLIGGTVAFYHQHPEYLGVMPGELKASNRLRERMALAIMARIGCAHLSGDPPPPELALADSMRLPMALVQDTLDALMRAGFIAHVEEPVPGYVPARDLSSIALRDILVSARRAHEHGHLVPDDLPREPAAEALMTELEAAAAQVLGERSLRSLLVDEVAGGSSEPTPTVALKTAR